MATIQEDLGLGQIKIQTDNFLIKQIAEEFVELLKTSNHVELLREFQKRNQLKTQTTLED